ncbi:hypothetical protein Trydic_g3573 [Trypoxylus dichotomus]
MFGPLWRSEVCDGSLYGSRPAARLRPHGYPEFGKREREQRCKRAKSDVGVGSGSVACIYARPPWTALISIYD